jgi:hypothetical protein
MPLAAVRMQEQETLLAGQIKVTAVEEKTRLVAVLDSQAALALSS